MSSFLFPEPLLLKDLHVSQPTEEGALTLSWSPLDTGNTNYSVNGYQVSYKLARHLACEGDAEDTETYFRNDVEGTTATLTGLDDYARYYITVTPDLGHVSPSSDISGSSFGETLASCEINLVVSLKSVSFIHPF